MLVGEGSTYKIKDFHSIWPWWYKGEGLYSNVDIGLDEPTDSTGSKIFDGTTVLALGDLNDDKRTDIIVTNKNQDILAIYFYDSDDMEFKHVKTLDLGNCKVSAANVISAPPYQMAVICTENDSYDYIKLFEDVHKANPVLSIDLTNHLLEKDSQPMFFDLNSDTYVDIVYNAYNPAEGRLTLQVIEYNKGEKSYTTDSSDFLTDYVYQEEGSG